MIPTVFTIPWLNIPIRGYGLMLMIGFLAATWWAARRAARVKCDPDLIINMGFVALIAAVVGARVFYVLHYWERNFADRGLLAVFDITEGGMEFYGGFIGAFIAVVTFLWFKGVSLRLYLDIMVPSVMLGMGIARIGCFLNGCCWGAPCMTELPWAVRFPYASPATYRQWEERQVTLPAELIYVMADGRGTLLHRDWLALNLKRLAKTENAYDEAVSTLQQAKKGNVDSQTLGRLTQKVTKAQKRRDKERQDKETQLVTFHERMFKTTHEHLWDLAQDARYASIAVHPSQLYASAGGATLAILLNAYFYRRKRHGMVLGVFLLLYPFMRVIEEVIRIDNPRDTAGLTISQFVSLVLFTSGCIYIYIIHRLPRRSPKAVPFVPPWDEPTPPKKQKKKQ